MFARRISAPFLVSALPLSPAVRCPILIPWEARPSWPSAGLTSGNTAIATALRHCWSTWRRTEIRSMADFLQKASERAALLLGLILLALPSLALAEEAARFVLKEADQNSFIRLDTVTGAVSHCASKAGEWNCKTLSDDRKELHDEIAALKQ